MTAIILLNDLFDPLAHPDCKNVAAKTLAVMVWMLGNIDSNESSISTGVASANAILMRLKLDELMVSLVWPSEPSGEEENKRKICKSLAFLVLMFVVVTVVVWSFFCIFIFK